MAKVDPATPQKAVFLPLIPNDGSPVFIACERGSEYLPHAKRPEAILGAKAIARNNPGK